MLPFLKPKPQTGVLVKEIKSSGEVKENHDEDHGLIACAEDFIRAVHTKDAEAAAKAWRAAFELLELEPHEEGSNTNSYDEMNEQAAKKENRE